MALNLHYNKQEILPELAKAVDEVAMETNSSVTECQSQSPLGTPSRSHVTSLNAAEGINQSVLSLLVKLNASMTTSCVSSPERLVKLALKDICLSKNLFNVVMHITDSNNGIWTCQGGILTALTLKCVCGYNCSMWKRTLHALQASLTFMGQHASIWGYSCMSQPAYTEFIFKPHYVLTC